MQISNHAKKATISEILDWQIRLKKQKVPIKANVLDSFDWTVKLIMYPSNEVTSLKDCVPGIMGGLLVSVLIIQDEEEWVRISHKNRLCSNKQSTVF